jgi:hypothetical protein
MPTTNVPFNTLHRASAFSAVAVDRQYYTAVQQKNRLTATTGALSIAMPLPSINVSAVLLLSQIGCAPRPNMATRQQGSVPTSASLLVMLLLLLTYQGKARTHQQHSAVGRQGHGLLFEAGLSGSCLCCVS